MTLSTITIDCTTLDELEALADWWEQQPEWVRSEVEFGGDGRPHRLQVTLRGW